MHARLFAVFLVLASLSCAASPKLLGTPVKTPLALVFRGTPEVAAHSDWRSIRSTADALLEGMKERGIAGYMPNPGVEVAAPRIELFIRHWAAKDGKKNVSPGAAAIIFGGLVGATIGLAHAGDVVVDCTVYREGEEAPWFRRRFVASTGEALASAILSRVFTERADDHGQDDLPGPERSARGAMPPKNR
jgi:hypothetical protein